MIRKGILTNRLYVLRAKKRCWSQKKVASLLGISRQTVISIEANKYSPSLMLAFQAANLFDEDISDVFQYHTVEECPDD